MSVQVVYKTFANKGESFEVSDVEDERRNILWKKVSLKVDIYREQKACKLENLKPAVFRKYWCVHLIHLQRRVLAFLKTFDYIEVEKERTVISSKVLSSRKS